MVKQYICSRCESVFTDKSKYTRHINRKYPCKIKNDIEISCLLCDQVVNGESVYLKHLEEECVKSKITTVKYSFKTKFFSKKVFPKIKESCDIYIIKNDFNIIIGTTKNLYNIYKKNSYEGYKLLYYYPIRDINELSKNLPFNLNDELYLNIEYILDILTEQIRLVNEECINDLYKPTEKVSKKYNCSLCNLSCNNAKILKEHLFEFHKKKKILAIKNEEYLIKNSSFINQLEDKDLQKKVIDMVKSNDIECQFCKKTYSNKYNLLRHQRNCNKLLIFMIIYILRLN